MNQYKFSLLFLFVFCLAGMFCHGQDKTGNESITIVTYYPSPVGSYKILRLMPTDDIDPDSDMCERKGEMFFSEKNDCLYFCDSNKKWQPVGTGSREESSTCGWFRGNCPLNWTLDTSLENNPRQVLPSEYPVNNEAPMNIRTRCQGIGSPSNGCTYFSFECDTSGFQKIIPKNVEAAIKTPAAACKRCFGVTNAGRAFSGAESCGQDCGCPGYPFLTSPTPGNFTLLACYRCRYEGDEKLPPLAATYQVSYCCPAE